MKVSTKFAILNQGLNPIEFDGFNCGEFGIIERLAAVLNPSNSRGLENRLGVSLSSNPVEFDGVGTLKDDSDYKGFKFETFRNLAHVIFRN
jgi:hypothetical protein